MQKKHQVHNLIILDESGSMSSIQSVIIQGFNELVQSIQGMEQKFPDQEHYVSFLSFNDLHKKWHLFSQPATTLKPIDTKNYRPSSMTPLYDAMGEACSRLRQTLEGQTDYNVLVTILTDGEENASGEFTRHHIQDIIQQLEPCGWTFTYMGTDHDVQKAAADMSIKNVMAFQKNSVGIRNMFRDEETARMNFYQKVREGKNTQFNYFKEDSEQSSPNDNNS